jgi:hypothetical protein
VNHIARAARYVRLGERLPVARCRTCGEYDETSISSDESGQLSSLSGLSTVGRFAINLALDGVDAESQCSWHLQTVLHGRRDRADL